MGLPPGGGIVLLILDRAHYNERIKMKPGTTLSPKQASFCGFVSNGHSQTDAYMKAYDTKKISRKAASNEATKLMKMDKVRGRGDDLKAESVIAKKAQKRITQDWIVERLRDKVQDEEATAAVQVRALEVLARIEGMFDESTKVTVTHRTPEEVRLELKSKLREYFGEMN